MAREKIIEEVLREVVGPDPVKPSIQDNGEEILNIKPEHIEGQTLLIPISKNGHSRRIPLTKKALLILQSSELPFRLTANALRLSWDRLKVKGNIKDLHFHDLRHDAISCFFEKGLSIPEVALISGHRDYKMLFHYTHLKCEDIIKKHGL